MTEYNINLNKPADNLAISGLRKSFGALEVLAGLDITAGPGEFVSLLGPSGSGKSTVFNILAGLEVPDSGRIEINGRPVDYARPQFAYMPQRDALMPWRKVIDNIILGQEISGVPRRQAYQAVAELLPVFGLQGFEQNYPFELSGGMRQRAAFLRTLLSPGNILLLDEPFGALDALTRATLQDWLAGMLTRIKRTVLFITHDVEEALLLSDRVYVLSRRPARIEMEMAVPFETPRNRELTVQPEFARLKLELLAALQQGVVRLEK